MVTEDPPMSNGTKATVNRHQRASHLAWVEIGKLVPLPKGEGQREFSHAWATDIASSLNIEGIGFPVVSHRDGNFYILDGQHRVAALRIFGFAPEDTIQCEVYEGLSP